jgi:hypothetical protein
MAGAPEDVMLSLKNFDVNGKVDLSHPFVAFYKKMSAEEKANFKQGLVPLVEPMFQMPVDPAPVAQAKNVLKELVDMVETEQPTTLPEATQPTQQTGEVNFDKLREESKKKGVPIFELKDWSLKEPIQNGENTITHIIPNPTQGNFKVLFNRPTGQWMAKFSLKNGVVQKKLFKNEGTKSEPSMISSSKMSEDFMDESISAAIPADLITSITEDLKNVPPQTDTKLNTKDFAYTESIDKKYGIKKTLGDIAQPTTAPTQQTSEVEVVSRYTNADVKANPNKIYVFGDNNQRRGKGGQAIIRDEPNAFGIITKEEPNNTEAAFMDDEFLNSNPFGKSNKERIDEDIAKIKTDGRPVVFPKDGIGTGLAKLKEKAPKTYAYLKQRLREEFGFDNDTGEVSQPTQQTQSQKEQATEAIDKKIMEQNGIQLSMFNELTEEEKEMMRNQERNCK